MEICNETVHSLIEKEPNEIKSWLSNVINTEINYKKKLKDFNILLLIEIVNSKTFKAEDRNKAIDWCKLNLSLLFLLKDIYPEQSHFYDATIMKIRTSMIFKFGEEKQCDILDLSVITNWINLKNIDLEELKKLHIVFLNTKDKAILQQYIEIKSKILVLKELIESDESTDSLIHYITSNAFFRF